MPAQGGEAGETVPDTDRCDGLLLPDTTRLDNPTPDYRQRNEP